MAELCSECGTTNAIDLRNAKRCQTIGCPKKGTLCKQCWASAAQGKSTVEVYCAGCKKTSVFPNTRRFTIPRLTVAPLLLIVLFVPGYIWKLAGMIPEERLTWYPDISHMTQSFVLSLALIICVLVGGACSFCVVYPLTFCCRRLGVDINFS